MREIKFEPTVVKNGDYEGYVRLKAPTFTERLELMERVNFALGEDGKAKTSLEQLGPVRRMVELSKPFYLEVSLKRKEDGAQFQSYDDLNYDDQCGEILTEVANRLLEGFGPSKKK